jgi:hypothetical protein
MVVEFTLVLSGDLGQEIGPLTMVWLAFWYGDSREDLSNGKSEIMVNLVESVDSVLMNDMFLTLGQLELSSRDHVLLFGCRHRVVEQGCLVGVFLIISIGLFDMKKEKAYIELGT